VDKHAETRSQDVPFWGAKRQAGDILPGAGSQATF